jgi:ABC-type uncharacterized transport system auxiliary subunit
VTARPWTALVLIALLASGCLGQSQPEKTRYLLDMAPTVILDPGDRGRVQIARMRVDRPFERKGLVYRVSEDRYVADFYHEFYSTPGDLIRTALEQWFERSGLFTHVVGPSEASRPDWRIEGYVHELYADFSRPGKQVAVVEIDFAVLDAHSVQLDVAFSKSYRSISALRDRDPASVAHGLRDAVHQVFKALNEDLREALPAVEGAGVAKEGEK